MKGGIEEIFIDIDWYLLMNGNKGQNFVIFKRYLKSIKKILERYGKNIRKIWGR